MLVNCFVHRWVHGRAMLWLDFFFFLRQRWKSPKVAKRHSFFFHFGVLFCFVECTVKCAEALFASQFSCPVGVWAPVTFLLSLAPLFAFLLSGTLSPHHCRYDKHCRHWWWWRAMGNQASDHRSKSMKFFTDTVAGEKKRKPKNKMPIVKSLRVFTSHRMEERLKTEEQNKNVLKKRWHPGHKWARYSTIIPMRFPLPNRLKIYTSEKRKHKTNGLTATTEKELHAGHTTNGDSSCRVRKTSSNSTNDIAQANATVKEMNGWNKKKIKKNWKNRNWE